MLFARTTGAWKFGLERTLALLRALDDPHLQVPVLHVGGTNGKGSVVATVDTLLRARGLRVARYTSPHLVDFRERIVVDGRPIPEEAVLAFLDRWMAEIDRLEATFFEATTAMAFDFFTRSAADVAVVEVGLGGRLDATNVVQPRAAAVTSIGIDHTQYLGETAEGIAREKAGIFKRGAAAVIGEHDPSLRALLAALAADAGAAPIDVVADRISLSDVEVTDSGTTFSLEEGGARRRVRTSLVGRHQARNAATALALVESSGFALEPDPRDLSLHVALRGRFDRVGSVVFDVAHNRDGAAVLAETLGLVSMPRPRVALLCVLADKDWPGMMAELARQIDAVVLTHAPSAPADRAWDLGAAEHIARALPWDVTAEADFERALSLATSRAATTVITGSFHTVGDAMACLQVSPLLR